MATDPGDDRQEYEVLIAAIEHTMLLDQNDVDRYGDAVKKAKPLDKAQAPANKSAS